MKRGQIKGLLAYYLSPLFLPNPSSLSIFLTPYCNLKCSVCWQYGEKGIFRRTGKGNDYLPLSVDIFFSLIDEVAGFRPRIMLWGGEPLVYPDVLILIRLIKEKGLHLKLITNGTLLEENAEALVSLGVNEIVVSVDGPEELHDRIRGVPNTFKKVKEGLIRLSRQKKRLKTSNPRIIVNFTISALNHSHIIDAVDAFESMPIDSFIISHLWYTTRELGEKHELLLKELLGSDAPSWPGFLTDVSPIDIDVVSRQLKSVVERKKTFPITFIPVLKKSEISPYYKEPDNTLSYTRCMKPWRTVSILPNGDMTPCSDRPDFIVGNIKEKSFSALWRSAKFQLFRNVIRKRGLLPLCYRCCELFLR